MVVTNKGTPLKTGINAINGLCDPTQQLLQCLKGKSQSLSSP